MHTMGVLADTLGKRNPLRDRERDGSRGEVGAVLQTLRAFLERKIQVARRACFDDSAYRCAVFGTDGFSQCSQEKATADFGNITRISNSLQMPGIRMAAGGRLRLESGKRRLPFPARCAQLALVRLTQTPSTSIGILHVPDEPGLPEWHRLEPPWKILGTFFADHLDNPPQQTAGEYGLQGFARCVQNPPAPFSSGESGGLTRAQSAWRRRSAFPLCGGIRRLLPGRRVAFAAGVRRANRAGEAFRRSLRPVGS